jgi:hypothetical protein
MVVKNKWAIHNVIVSTRLNKVKARKIAFDILHKKPIFYRKTKEHHRFDNIYAPHFSKFRTKVINPDVSIIFGLLKPEFQHLEGGSIASLLKSGYDKVKNVVSDVFSVRDGFNNKNTAIIKELGNQKIISISIVRSPVKSYITNILNVVSYGKFLKALNKTPYEKLFHLSMNIILDNYQSLTIEKNEVADINKTFKQYPSSEMMPVDLKNQTITLNDLLTNGLKNAGSIEKFFRYNPWSNNCQNFIMYLLNGSNLNSPIIENFVLQDIKELVENTPEYVKTFGYSVTTLAGIMNKLIGKGKKGGIRILN